VKPASAPARILLCRTDKLGDVVLAIPCALLVKRLYPQCRVSFLAQPYTAPLVKLIKEIDEVIVAEPGMPVRSLAGLLRGQQIDAAIALYPEYRLAKALRMAKIPLRAGIAYRWYSPLFNYRHREHRKKNVKHELEYNLSLTYAALNIGGRWEDKLPSESIFPLDLKFPEELLRNVSERIADMNPDGKRLVAIHPGGGGSANVWRWESYGELGSELAKLEHLTVALTGGSAEINLCNHVQEIIGSHSHNLCGAMTLSELAAFYQKVDLLITNSTGPLHLARAVGSKVIGLFPRDHAMSPVRWGPYLMRDNVLMPPERGAMSDIPVDLVFEKIISILNKQ